METITLVDSAGFSKPVSAYLCYSPNFAIYKEINGKRRVWTVNHHASGFTRDFATRGAAARFVKYAEDRAKYWGDDLSTDVLQGVESAYWKYLFKSVKL